MRECQRQLGMERGKRMMEMVERITGAPCPCSQGKQPCLLVPASSKGGVVDLPTPRMPRSEVVVTRAGAVSL